MEAPLNRHGSEKFDKLFEQNTAEPGSLSDIVDKHAGDAIFLSDSDDGGAKGADAGLADFVGEMNMRSEENDWEEVVDNWESVDDDAITSEAVSGVDITGTAQGVARGFGSHLPLDLGADGFQIKSMPNELGRGARHDALKPGEELDDYDDPK
jgi:hypothetical protein